MSNLDHIKNVVARRIGDSRHGDHLFPEVRGIPRKVVEAHLIRKGSRGYLLTLECGHKQATRRRPGQPWSEKRPLASMTRLCARCLP